jgi:SagB-type dehydrogenase family enzyme
MRYQFSQDAIVSIKAGGKVAWIALSNEGFLEGDAWLAELISELHNENGFTREDFTAALSKFANEGEAAEIFLRMAALRLIEIQSDEIRIDENPEYPWPSLGWAAADLYHRATVYTDFIQGDAEGWKTQSLGNALIAATSAGPPICKTYKAAPRIELSSPGPLVHTDLADVLLKRRTKRSFPPNTNLSRQTLSTILYYAAKQHGVLRNKHLGDHMLRTSPSGGARHPVEIYPQIHRSEDLSLGSTYYDPSDHSLRLLGDVSEDLIFRIGQRQSGCAGMAVGFLVTARFSRNLWKYRYSKSLSFTLLDVGHFVQTLLLCCVAMGLKTFLTPAVNVREAHEHLGLKNVHDECCVYLVTAG